GWTTSTVHGRLYRGRDLLRRRLAKRGLSLGAGLIATALSQASASGALTFLQQATAQAVLRHTAGNATGTLSAQVVALAQEALPLRPTVKPRLGIAFFLAVTMIAGGAGLLAHHPLENNDDDKKQAAAAVLPARAKPEEKKHPRLDRFGDPLPPDAIARLGT